MRNSLTRTPSVFMFGALLAGSVCVSACGADREPSASAASPQANASVPKTGRLLSTSELRALTLREGEVPQAYEGAIPVRDRKPETGRSTFPPVSDPACEQVLDVADADGAPSVVDQTFNWKDNIFPGGSTLASYNGAEAQTAFSRLGEGLKACRTFTGTGYTGKYRSELAVEGSPRVGDEAVRYSLTSPMNDGSVRHDDHVVVRVGSVIAAFTAMEIDKHTAFPPDLIAKQVERLRNAQRP